MQWSYIILYEYELRRNIEKKKIFEKITWKY